MTPAEHDELVANTVELQRRLTVPLASMDLHLLVASGRAVTVERLARRWRWPARDVGRFLLRAEWATMGHPRGGEA